MIEFVLSKTTMMIVAFSLILSLTAAFGELNEGLSKSKVEERVERIVGALWEVDSFSQMRANITIDDAQLPRDGILMVRNGSVTFEWSEGKVMKSAPWNLLLEGGNQLEACIGDVLHISSITIDGERLISIQSEKVDAISATASEKRLHSSSVL